LADGVPLPGACLRRVERDAQTLFVVEDVLRRPFDRLGVASDDREKFRGAGSVAVRDDGRHERHDASVAHAPRDFALPVTGALGVRKDRVQKIFPDSIQR